MRLRLGEAGLLAIPLILSVLFFLASSWVGGTVLLALSLLGAASRAEIVEHNIAGFHARSRSVLILLRMTALWVIYVLLVYLFFVMRQEHWTRDRHGLVAFYASAGLSIFLIREMWRSGNEAQRWMRGGEAEQAVGAELDRLREQGWFVIHNVARDFGNVDHFVAGPVGAFAIETKSGRHRSADRGQAVSNAVWAKGRFGARWVTPILCVGTDPPDQPLMIGVPPLPWTGF